MLLDYVSSILTAAVHVAHRYSWTVLEAKKSCSTFGLSDHEQICDQATACWRPTFDAPAFRIYLTAGSTPY